MPTSIELLTAKHQREGFDCGEPALNEFLHRLAWQQQRRGLSKTYVAVDGVSVTGFVTVSAGQVAADTLPASLKLPRYPVPVLRIGRLAVAVSHQGCGMGQDLLAHALRLALDLDHRVGVYAVVVDAKHETAKAFYQRLGFLASLDNPLCLYLPMATLRQAAGE